ncbi:unnamed protein product [Nezara viridula]|uniref:Uncharacterized protein n=1 Tax=Nezara viridula TaxID=85310 RepID=A0A9P0EEG3_NEZVI|nr:unnamed protein product [Nezara viridula]
MSTYFRYKEIEPILMGILSEEIPSYEALILEEDLPPLNLRSIIDSVSSVPLYDRLDINKGTLCENERKLMELQAAKYYNKISHLIIDKKIKTHKDEFCEFESEYSQSEECSDLFLKNFYNCSDNDELLMRIKGNLTFDEAIQESTDEVKLFTEVELQTPSKEFLQFFLHARDGKYDNLIVNESLASHDLSSDLSSDEKDEIVEDKIKELSYKLKFSDSSNSKFLEPIFNASKHSAFEIISESSSNIRTLRKEEIFLSDSESENDLKKKHLVFEVDKTNNGRLPYQTKKDIKVLKKNRRKYDTRKDKINSESKCGEKKDVKNIQRPSSHSSIPTMDQEPKINLNNVTTSDATSTNVLVSPKQLTNINENIKKISNKKKVNNETSSSDDEDWEDLAKKNLFLRSKTLGQKVTTKR